MNRIIFALMMVLVALSTSVVSETLPEASLKKAGTPTPRQATIDGYFIVKFKDKGVHQSLRKDNVERQSQGVKTGAFEHAIFDDFEAEHIRTLARELNQGISIVDLLRLQLLMVLNNWFHYR